jgi:hypothetical protein
MRSVAPDLPWCSGASTGRLRTSRKISINVSSPDATKPRTCVTGIKNPASSSIPAEQPSPEVRKCAGRRVRFQSAWQNVFTGYLDSILVAMFVVGVILVLIGAGRRCWMTLRGARIPKQAFGPPVVDGQIRMGCC